MMDYMYWITGARIHAGPAIRCCCTLAEADNGKDFASECNIA